MLTTPSMQPYMVLMSQPPFRPMVAPERTFSRGRGCWNCIHYDTGMASKDRWALHRTALILKLNNKAPLTRIGDELPEGTPQKDAGRERLDVMTKSIEVGSAGICSKGQRPQSEGGPEGDFVDCRFLCNRWNGRDGHSLATAGHILDKLGDELQDIADDRVRKRRQGG